MRELDKKKICRGFVLLLLCGLLLMVAACGKKTDGQQDPDGMEDVQGDGDNLGEEDANQPDGAGSEEDAGSGAAGDGDEGTGSEDGTDTGSADGAGSTDGTDTGSADGAGSTDGTDTGSADGADTGSADGAGSTDGADAGSADGTDNAGGTGAGSTGSTDGTGTGSAGGTNGTGSGSGASSGVGAGNGTGSAGNASGTGDKGSQAVQGTGNQSGKPSGGKDTGSQTNKPSGSKDTGSQTNKPSGGKDTGSQTNKPSGGKDTGNQTNKPSGGKDTGSQTNKPSGGKDTGNQTNKPSGGKDTGNQSGNNAEPEKTIFDESLEAILDAVYANVKSELPNLMKTEITEDMAEYYLGTAEVEYEEALSSDASIISIPYSVCLLRLPEGADVEAAKKKIVESLNPYKWICVGVEPKNVLVGSVDRVILLAMTDKSQEIMDAFLSLQTSGKKAEVLSQAVSPDKNGMLFFQDYAAKALVNDGGKSAAKLGEKIESIYSKYLKGQKNVYYSVIPDKSFFIPNTTKSVDSYFDDIAAVQDKVKNASYIPLIYNLSLTDYYKTDIHWRQEKLFQVVSELGNTMGFTVPEADFTENTLKSYQGMYASYYSKIPSEDLVYMTSKATGKVKVSAYEKGEHTGAYYLDEWKGKTPYNLFLGGPNPLVTITNSSLKNGKELIIFGDSFMSSLAPLLSGAYEKITLVDLRFVMSSHLSEVMEFTGQDVLFLYNMAVVNNSALLK